MHDFAHRPFESALCAAIALCAVSSACGQDPILAPRFADVDAMAVRALEARDPVTRGEAALWLADSGKVEQYPAILATAQDSAAPARHRAILAVGRLGVPGAESFLGRVLHQAALDSPEAAIAAFALGTLGDEVPAPAIDLLLEHVQGGSRKRQMAVLTALLGGFASRPHPARTTILQALRDDEVNRDDVVPILAQAALDRAGVKPTPARIDKWLAHPSAGLRLLALEHWHSPGQLDQSAREHLLRMARSDRDPAVRTEALTILARSLDPNVLDLADRGLRSTFPAEVANSARLLCALAGDARREHIEAQALAAATPPGIRASLLDALGGRVSAAALLACADTARDPKAAPDLRVASALTLARADSTLAESTLQDLFACLEHPVHLEAIARALHARELLALAATRLTTPDANISPAILAAHIEAVARVDHVLGTELFLALVKSERVRDGAVGPALAALRRARLPTVSPTVLALLPVAVAALQP